MFLFGLLHIHEQNGRHSLQYFLWWNELYLFAVKTHSCILCLSLSAMDGVPFMISEKFACASSDVSRVFSLLVEGHILSFCSVKPVLAKLKCFTCNAVLVWLLDIVLKCVVVLVEKNCVCNTELLKLTVPLLSCSAAAGGSDGHHNQVTGWDWERGEYYRRIVNMKVCASVGYHNSAKFHR